MDIQGVSSSYAPTSSIYWKYDVFLSFRGEDTRKNFTSHLYHGLTSAGINVFIDDKELERGQCIRPELLRAIEESRFLIIIFSKNYASSSWCLDELVKITECINTQQQTVIPIFYDVEPSTVRKQFGEFQEAFEKHEDRFKDNKSMVQMWREALKRVADISGYDLKNRSESEVVQEIVKQISTKLSLLTHMNLIGLVGLDSPVEELKRLIGGGSDVCMIGICGMGGIGKTTIARVIYHFIYLEFEGSSFLADVGQNSKNDKKVISLQKQLLYETLKGTNINIFDVSNGTYEIRRRLHNKKVLVVIDDVTHVSQLRNLAGERGWFGPGSKIIITTRDEKLLFGVDQVYKVKLLNHDDSLKLFSLNAFKKCQPPKDYLELSKSIVQYCCGLPLALKVLGCSLCGSSNVDDWKSAIERLRKEPEDEIINKLKISFDGLSRTEKKIFLDIACFFKGENRDRVTSILDACGFHSTIGISILIQRHLINISKYNNLWMHDLLQEMGREIVKRESPDEIGKRSRLWEKEDVYRLFRDNMGSEVIEGIMVEEDLDVVVRAEAFSKMSNLRLLKIKKLKLQEGTLNRLSNNLRLLEWYGYPLKSLPSSLELDKLVELKLHHSNIESLWKGIKRLSLLRTISLKNCQNLREIPNLTCAPNLWKFLIEGCPKLCGIVSCFQVRKQFFPSEQLTSLHLENCQKLMEIPDLACFPNLVGLVIEECPTLSRIHSTLLVLKNLVLLDVRNCTRLKSLPSKIHLKSLEIFMISGCPKLENFPEVVGHMNALTDLTIAGTAIKDIPLPDGLLPRLIQLRLANNNKLVTLPSTLSGLKSLYKLSIEGCSKLENVQETLGQVESLRSLELLGTPTTLLMSSAFLMKNLDQLHVIGKQGSPSKSYFPSSLMPRRSSNAMTLMLPSLSGSTCSLRMLNLRDCNLEEDDIPCDFFASLISLEILCLSWNNFVSLPTTINRLSKLERLYMNDCRRLQSLTGLPSSTYKVDLNGCTSLETLSGTFKLCNLECTSCFKLLGVNNLMSSMSRNYLKGRLPNERSDFSGSYFSMVAPGDEVPEWITYQGVGSSIRMERPPDLHDNKLVGVVACCVFVFNSHFFSKTNGVDLQCYLFQDGKIIKCREYLVVKPWYSMSEHLWLLSFHVNEFDRLRISFFTDSDPPGVEWKICGAHPMYERDLNDLDLATSNWSSSSLGKLNESPREYFTASEGPSDCDGDESLKSPQEYLTALTEPSDCDGDEPEPKRFKSV